MTFKFYLPEREKLNNSPNGKKMLSIIEDDNDNKGIVISGCPGSGKTTVAIYRLLYLLNRGHTKTLLLSYHRMLIMAIKNITVKKEDVSDENIQTALQWFSDTTGILFNPDNKFPSSSEITHQLDKTSLGLDKFQEMIIDEAQDLPLKTFQSFPNFSRKVTICADDAQRIHDHGATLNEIVRALKKFGKVRQVDMQYNYRNSYEIYNFSRQFVPENKNAKDPIVLERLKQKISSEKPVIYLFNTDEKKSEWLKRLLTDTDGNIAVLLSSKLSVNMYVRKIQKMDFSCSYYHSDMKKAPEQLERILVTTYKSAKGLEFDAVIIPLTEFKDEKVKRREYFVACVRAIRNLYILCFKELDPILKKFDANSYVLKDMRIKLT